MPLYPVRFCAGFTLAAAGGEPSDGYGDGDGDGQAGHLRYPEFTGSTGEPAPSPRA